MKKIEIFDPAMCCSTGICGPSIDKDLLRFATLVDSLKNMGVFVKRYNLSSEPQAFLKNQKVYEMLNSEGVKVLPITLVDGKVVVIGKYPSTKQMCEWTDKNLMIVPSSSVAQIESLANNYLCCAKNNEKGDHCNCSKKN